MLAPIARQMGRAGRTWATGRQTQALVARGQVACISQNAKEKAKDKSNITKNNMMDFQREKAIYAERSEIVSRLWAVRDHVTDDLGSPDTEHKVLTKTMADSYLEEHLNFGSDKELRDRYRNLYGGVRMGKLLEDLDAMAGTIGYLHCDDKDQKTRPLTIVTASVDRLDMLRKLSPKEDIKLCGHVSYVGTSSMEIMIRVDGRVPSAAGTDPDDGYRAICVATFIMVARDPFTNRPATVSRLLMETEEEKMLFKMGKENAQRRKEQRAIALDRTQPSETETRILHERYLQNRKASASGNGSHLIPMKDTAMETNILCQPQDRNIHNKVFGGFLMRKAYEQAWANSIIFSRSQPTFIAMDDVSFAAPVEIGSILQLSSCVSAAEGPKHRSVQVRVEANVIDPMAATRHLTNTFNFTFVCDSQPNTVVPETYSECMTFIEGLRKREMGIKASQMTRKITNFSNFE